MSSAEETVLLLTFARRGEEKAIRGAIGALRAALPHARMVSVGTPVSAPILRALGVETVVLYAEDKSAQEVVREIRRYQPVVAAIVYGGPGFAGHLKLELLAWLSRARQVRRFLPSATAIPTSKLRIACSICAKTLGIALRATGGVAVCATAFICLRAAEFLPGGHRASRA